MTTNDLAPSTTGLTPEEKAIAQQIATAKSITYLAATRLKRLLASRLGPQEGFKQWRRLVPNENYPDADQLRRGRIGKLRDAAEAPSICIEVTASGQNFEILPPQIIGESDHHAVRGTQRAVYVTCLADARPRSGSFLINARGDIFGDWEDSEIARIESLTEFRPRHLDFDPHLFCCENDEWAGWAMVPDEGAEPRLERAFWLMGMNTNAFGHWIYEYLPKYMTFLMTGDAKGVPVLVDACMPRTHREALELLAPEGTEIIERDPLTTTFVRNLWVSSNYRFPPFNMGDQDWYGVDPRVYASAIKEIASRIDLVAVAQRGPDKIFLARKADLRRKLLNVVEIEEIARENGFSVVYPEDLSFAQQFRLVRDARFILGPEGSAFALGCFGRPGTKLAILNHPHTQLTVHLAGVFGELGLNTTIVTGPVAGEHPEFAHFSDYSIDAEVFRDFIADWLH